MPEKKEWTEKEDQVLRHLFEVEKMNKWSKIAQRMSDEFKLPARNGKQCRQRYQNFLDPSFQHLQWTPQEEQRMYDLHNEIGNKWAQIALQMPGRTDNCVKNHMYSKLRKAIRKLNKTIAKEFKKQIKEIRQTVLYKVIEATDENFKSEDTADKFIAKMSRDLKNQLLNFSNDEDVPDSALNEVKQLAEKVQQFSRVYKRKPKKQRRGNAQVKNLMKMPKIQKFKCPSDGDDSDDYQIQVSNQESIHLGEDHKKQPNFEQLYVPKRKEVIEVSNLSSFRLKKISDEQELRRQSLNQSYLGIEKTLKQAGILEDANVYIPPFMKQSISQSNISQRNEQFNLGDSIEGGTNLFKFSIVLRPDGELDQENKLFKSMNE